MLFNHDMMHILAFLAVTVSTVCMTMNKETMAGHLAMVDILCNFMLLNSLLYCLDSIITAPMILYAGDRRFRYQCAISSVMAETCMKEACGEVAGEAVPEAVPGQAAPSEAGSDDTDKAVCSETCSEGVEQGSGGKSEKVVGDTDSAASGANTHVIM